MKLLPRLIYPHNGSRLQQFLSCMILLTCATTYTAIAQEQLANEPSCPFVKVAVERLPDISTPRAGHATFCIDGELVVFGGHTTGFKPTPTAEYYSDGKWHSLMMTYSHDDGLYVGLESGKVLLAGGHKDNLGIGQTYETELYDPSTHTFGNHGCLDSKRCLSTGAEIDSGLVVISGNWYSPDDIEIFDRKGFSHLKRVSVERSSPIILRTSENNAIIFGSYGIHGEDLGDSTSIVDCVHGDSFTVPLLKEWRPMTSSIPFHNNYNGFIGDISNDDYKYLLLAKDSTAMKSPSGPSPGKTVLLMVNDTLFSLMPTTCPIPNYSNFGSLIHWYGSVIADRENQRAYISGIDKFKRLYILSIDYTQSPSPLTLYYTDQLPDCGFNTPILTSDGNLAIVGGNFNKGLTSDNYAPYATAYIIKIHPNKVSPDKALSMSPWQWVLIALGIITVIVATIFIIRRLCHNIGKSTIKSHAPRPDETLFSRVCELMEQQQMFRNNELKISDVASALFSNTKYVLDCIKSSRNQTFTQFINTYRIEYAQKQLLENPSKAIVEIYMDSGFSSERSFFRSFKEITGMTTREWLNIQQK